MKVYGMIVQGPGRQYRAIVAVKTQKQAAEAFRVKLHHFRDYASATGNEHEVAVAMSKPGAVFWRPAHNYSVPYAERSPMDEI